MRKEIESTKIKEKTEVTKGTRTTKIEVINLVILLKKKLTVKLVNLMIVI